MGEVVSLKAVEDEEQELVVVEEGDYEWACLALGVVGAGCPRGKVWR